MKEKDKQKEELSDSMKKLDIEGSSSGSPNFKRKPVIIIVVGMAGQSLKDCIYFILHFQFCNVFLTKSRSLRYQTCTILFLFYSVYVVLLIWNITHLCLGSGKTTLMHRLVAHTHLSNIRGYVMNLDPAVMTLPYASNIDIRDTVKYKEVMKQFNLGPNGGILTSLNLFATKFDEVKFPNQYLNSCTV